MEQFTSRYFRGQGPVFLATRAADGSPEGLTFIGDVGKVDITPNVERGEVIENVTGSNGVGTSFLKRASYTMSLAMRSIRKDHLAKLLQGELTDKVAGSVAAGSPEAITGYHDKFTPLDNNKVSSVVVKDVTDSTTYAADTDYVLHADEGLIEVLSTGSIGDGDTLHISYDYAAQYHVAAAPANLDYYLLFAGKNSADDDKQTRCEIYKIKLDPGVMNLISSDASEGSINGVVQQDSLRAAGDQFLSWKVET